MRSLKKILKIVDKNTNSEQNLGEYVISVNPNNNLNINNVIVPNRNIYPNEISLLINNLPVSPIGLPVGSVWVDENGFMRIV